MMTRTERGLIVLVVPSLRRMLLFSVDGRYLVVSTISFACHGVLFLSSQQMFILY